MTDMEDRGHLLTEQNNPNSQNLDELSTLEMVDVFNQEDQRTVDAIAQARTHLAQAINLAAASMREGGRLFLRRGRHQRTIRRIRRRRMSAHFLHPA